MGKRISILIGIVVLAAAFCQLLLPGIISGNLANRIKEAARAENVTANVRAMPGFMLLAGQMDNLDVVVDNAWLGDIQVSRLILHGKICRWIILRWILVTALPFSQQIIWSLPGLLPSRLCRICW